MITFTAKIWNNGHYHASGAGYGIKISLANREQFFNRTCQTVFLHLSGLNAPIEVNVAKPSFWTKTCGELIKKEIGVWYLRNHQPRWKRGYPPTVIMKQISERKFSVVFE